MNNAQQGNAQQSNGQQNNVQRRHAEDADREGLIVHEHGHIQRAAFQQAGPDDGGHDDLVKIEDQVRRQPDQIRSGPPLAQRGILADVELPQSHQGRK